MPTYVANHLVYRDADFGENAQALRDYIDANFPDGEHLTALAVGQWHDTPSGPYRLTLTFTPASISVGGVNRKRICANVYASFDRNSPPSDADKAQAERACQRLLERVSRDLETLAPIDWVAQKYRGPEQTFPYIRILDGIRRSFDDESLFTHFATEPVWQGAVTHDGHRFNVELWLVRRPLLDEIPASELKLEIANDRNGDPAWTPEQAQERCEALGRKLLPGILRAAADPSIKLVTTQVAMLSQKRERPFFGPHAPVEAAVKSIPHRRVHIKHTPRFVWADDESTLLEVVVDAHRSGAAQVATEVTFSAARVGESVQPFATPELQEWARYAAGIDARLQDEFSATIQAPAFTVPMPFESVHSLVADQLAEAFPNSVITPTGRGFWVERISFDANLMLNIEVELERHGDGTTRIVFSGTYSYVRLADEAKALVSRQIAQAVAHTAREIESELRQQLGSSQPTHSRDGLE